MRSLTVLSAATLRLLDHEKRRTSRIDLHQLLKEVLRTYRPFLKGRDVEVVTSFASGDPYLRGQPASVESIITNLLNNSIAAFEDAATQLRVIDISTQILGNLWSLSVSDSGPGITGIRKSDVWLPGRTTRKHGTGLGLTIVRDACERFGWTGPREQEGPTRRCRHHRESAHHRGLDMLEIHGQQIARALIVDDEPEARGGL